MLGGAEMVHMKRWPPIDSSPARRAVRSTCALVRADEASREKEGRGNRRLLGACRFSSWLTAATCLYCQAKFCKQGNKQVGTYTCCSYQAHIS